MISLTSPSSFLSSFLFFVSSFFLISGCCLDSMIEDDEAGEEQKISGEGGEQEKESFSALLERRRVEGEEQGEEGEGQGKMLLNRGKGILLGRIDCCLHGFHLHCIEVRRQNKLILASSFLLSCLLGSCSALFSPSLLLRLLLSCPGWILFLVVFALQYAGLSFFLFLLPSVCLSSFPSFAILVGSVRSSPLFY